MNEEKMPADPLSRPWWLGLPVCVSFLFAVSIFLNVGGYFVPDTMAFLGEGRVVGEPEYWHVISPAYPMFLDMIQMLVPDPAWRMKVLVGVQQLGMVLMVGLLQWIGTKWCGRKLGWGLGMLAAVHLPYYLFAQTSQTEGLYMVLVVFVFAALTAGWKREQWKWFFGAGLLAGLAIAQRGVGLALFGSVVLTFLLTIRRPVWKTTFTPLLLFLLGVSLMIGVFVLRNGSYHGRATLVDGKGLHFFNRVIKEDHWLPDTPEVAQLREVASSIGYQSLLIENLGFVLQSELHTKAGMRYEDIDALLKTVAVQTMKARPWRTVKTTAIAMLWNSGYHHPRKGILWTGYRPGSGPAHRLFTESAWEDQDRVNRMRGALPPYNSVKRFGEWFYVGMDYLGQMSLIWRGPWVFAFLPLLCVLGLLKRNPILLVASGSALGQHLAAALAEAPQTRFWDTSNPGLMLGLVVGISEFLRWAEARNAAAVEKKSKWPVPVMASVLVLSMGYPLSNLVNMDEGRVAGLEAANRIQLIGAGFMRHARENEGDFPLVQEGSLSWEEQIAPYLDDEVKGNPKDGFYSAFSDSHGIGKGGRYAYNALLAKGQREGNGPRVPWNIRDCVLLDNLVVVSEQAVDDPMADGLLRQGNSSEVDGGMGMNYGVSGFDYLVVPMNWRPQLNENPTPLEDWLPAYDPDLSVGPIRYGHGFNPPELMEHDGEEHEWLWSWSPDSAFLHLPNHHANAVLAEVTVVLYGELPGEGIVKIGNDELPWVVTPGGGTSTIQGVMRLEPGVEAIEIVSSQPSRKVDDKWKSFAVCSSIARELGGVDEGIEEEPFRITYQANTPVPEPLLGQGFYGEGDNPTLAKTPENIRWAWSDEEAFVTLFNGAGEDRKMEVEFDMYLPNEGTGVIRYQGVDYDWVGLRGGGWLHVVGSGILPPGEEQIRIDSNLPSFQNAEGNWVNFGVRGLKLRDLGAADEVVVTGFRLKFEPLSKLLPVQAGEGFYPETIKDYWKGEEVVDWLWAWSHESSNLVVENVTENSVKAQLRFDVKVGSPGAGTIQIGSRELLWKASEEMGGVTSINVECEMQPGKNLIEFESGFGSLENEERGRWENFAVIGFEVEEIE